MLVIEVGPESIVQEENRVYPKGYNIDEIIVDSNTGTIYAACMETKTVRCFSFLKKKFTSTYSVPYMDKVYQMAFHLESNLMVIRDSHGFHYFYVDQDVSIPAKLVLGRCQNIMFCY